MTHWNWCCLPIDTLQVEALRSSLFKSGSLMDSNKSSFKTRKPSLQFRETSIFYIHQSIGFCETIYFWRNISITFACSANVQTNSTCVYTFKKSKVKFKFLGDKKGPTKGFLSGSLENWFSIFVSSLSFELSQLFLYFWRFVFMCVTHEGIN